MFKYEGNIKKNFKDILIQFTISKPVFKVFGGYLKIFKCFNNKMVQGNKTNIMFESKQGIYILKISSYSPFIIIFFLEFL